MTLKSAIQDLKETTLSAISGLFGKLRYLVSLRRQHGRYYHWGMESVYGATASERALKAAHSDVVSGILRTPLPSLEEDLKTSSAQGGVTPEAYVKEIREQGDDLLPEGRQNAPASTHLNSVLEALSSLERNRGRATRSTS
jgi:hypothetical protein